MPWLYVGPHYINHGSAPITQLGSGAWVGGPAPGGKGVGVVTAKWESVTVKMDMLHCSAKQKLSKSSYQNEKGMSVKGKRKKKKNIRHSECGSVLFLEA